MVMSRLSLPDSKGWGTCNPGPPAHYLKKNYIDRSKDIRMKVWNFQFDDNPFLTEEYKAWLKSVYTGLWFRRMILGEWAVADGAIYSNFNPDIHVIKELPDPNTLNQIRIGWIMVPLIRLYL